MTTEEEGVGAGLKELADSVPGPAALDLVNGHGQGYPEEDRYSFESRSLTAYSNYSDLDSVVNEPGLR